MERLAFHIKGFLVTIKNNLIEIEDKRLERNAKRESIRGFIWTLEQSDTLLSEFDESLWNATVEVIIVHLDPDITFEFRDGMKLDWNI